MNAILALTLLLLSQASDVLDNLERQLYAGFNEATYRRYLYYSRQQNEGLRLTEQSEAWLADYPDRQILRFGHAEGLLMSGNQQDGIGKFKSLYDDAPEWANEIIFTLNEVGNQEVLWFIDKERKRTSNPSLYARIVIEHYLSEGNDRKALVELALALSAGASPSSFRKAIERLSESLGKEKVLQAVRGACEELHFQLALELGDREEVKKAINSTADKRKLMMMGNLCERQGYLQEALLAYKGAGRDADAARALIALGRTKEAQAMLEADNSRAGRRQRALLLACSQDTYKDAITAFEELQRRYGSRPEYSVRIAALKLLGGSKRDARGALEGVPADSSVLFLQGILAAVESELDSLKRIVDRSMLSLPGNAYENDLLLLYKIALAQSSGLKDYALALTACHWGDVNDAYARCLKLAEQNVELADEALLLAAQSLQAMGRWQEAEAAYVTLIEGYPGSPLNTRAQFKRAVLLKEKLGNPTKAKQMLEELILRNPTSLYADLARQEM
jgi:TolA-binding protein